MIIAFNGIDCGWGNNGGTQSIFRMAEALSSLGHQVQLWSHSTNKFTWFPLSQKVKHIVTTIKKAPSVDVLISSGCKTTMDTFRYPRCKVSIQWLRAHETWMMDEKELFELYKLKMPLWVNSRWMKIFLTKMRTDIDVQYCGIPIEDFYKVPIDKEGFTIGALYSSKPRKRFRDIRALMKKIDARFAIYGNGKCDVKGYVQQPSLGQKRELYSACDAWVACSENEGLHIPPMEAALCGACVIANRRLHAGNIDYASTDTALLFSGVPDLINKIEMLRNNPDLGVRLNTRMKETVISKIGTVQENAQVMSDRLSGML